MQLLPCKLNPCLNVVSGRAIIISRPTIDEILERCAAAFGVTEADILSHDRHHDKVQARHFAMFLLLELRPMTVTTIGAYFGRSDHSTVCHAKKKVIGFIHAGDPIVEVYRAIYPEVVAKYERTIGRDKRKRIAA